jgi:CPA1 family monovalent cation:H+ antiporter
VLSSRLGEVERSIAAIKLQYPSYAEALECQILALSALRLEEQSIVRLREDSILSQEVFNGLARELAVRRRVQERRPRLDLGLDRRQLIDRVTLFGGISAVSRVEIERLMRPRLVMPGERIVRKGDRGDGMYFISSGAVEVRVAAPVRLGNGDFFGEMALIDDRPRNADVDALGFCQLLFLARRDFDRLLEREPVLRAHIHDRASARRRA